IEENRRGIEENRRGIEENRRGIEENRRGIEENRRVLDEHSQWMARKDAADVDLMLFLQDRFERIDRRFEEQQAFFAVMHENWRSDHRAVAELAKHNSQRIDRIERRLGM
ncbi:MAG: hypothetical protein KC910_12395, partial [Candidatus Eremiobacteraeota bacterium]|nr:hypothetical protein [Candidatus Eremiobacteraeota bacterium]